MYGTYQRLRVPVWASDMTVIRAIRRKLRRECRTPRKYRADRHKIYRTILRYHHDAQRIWRRCGGR